MDMEVYDERCGLSIKQMKRYCR